MLLDCQIFDESVKLRTIPQTFSHFIEIFADSQTIEVTLTVSRSYLTGENLKSGCFSCSIDSQQTEDLSFFDSKGKIVDSYLMLLRTINDINLSQLFSQYLVISWICIFCKFTLFRNISFLNDFCFSNLTFRLRETSHKRFSILKFFNH